MSKEKLRKIRQEVKEKALARVRWQWFKCYKKLKNVSKVCQMYGISRSQFYYWKNRIDLPFCGKGKGYSRYQRLLSYSRKPKTSPRIYNAEVIKLILRIRRRTNRGADHIWFMLRDKYQIYVSVTGVYKVLKREGLIKARRHKRKENKTYEAPKYLPGEKIQIDVKYVKIANEEAKKQNKEYCFVYQYTAIDVATGIKCKLIYQHHDPQSSIDFLNRVRMFYPFPVKVIQTDNGPEFTWRFHAMTDKTHPFTLQCELHGYEHHLIPPAYPRANSHVERTHRIDAEEVYRGRTFTSLNQLHKVNLRSLKYFNESRPQKTKHFLPPLKYGILKFQFRKQKLNYTVLNV